MKMSKKLILRSIAIALAALTVYFVGYLRGAARKANVAARSSVFDLSLVLRAMESGDTNRAPHYLETFLIGYLNNLEWTERYPMVNICRKSSWQGPSGERWEWERKWATERIKKKRDEINYCLQHPAEMEKRIEDRLNSGSTGMTVEVNNK